MNNSFYEIAPQIILALENNQPVVALESTVITHGLPHPTNYELAINLEEIITKEGAIPATIALLKGKMRIGLSPSEIEILASASNPRKISCRDIGIASAMQLTGGTTVATTVFVASQVGIKVFATGGIGGVHRDSSFDISADLQTLSEKPVIVVCAGAKAILDLPATLEILETLGVPVIGYQTDEFPAFYSSQSGLGVDFRADSIDEIVSIAFSHWHSGLKGSILVVVPPPVTTELTQQEVEEALGKALDEAKQKNIHGSNTTPYLLQRMAELTGGKSVKSNLDLLKNNAKIAAQISKSYTNLHGKPFSGSAY